MPEAPRHGSLRLCLAKTKRETAFQDEARLGQIPRPIERILESGVIAKNPLDEAAVDSGRFRARIRVD
ncbi:hypothetical protein, partial [Streptomyces pseudogriseolus]|uniref:hypothetical protein n=1 Tax=Streptomyces pseudogriseolus TaxID=36817 RepID=UPI003FA323AD